MQRRVISSYFPKVMTVLCTGLFLCSCNRSSRQVLEDSKTASHYSAKALRSLGGKHGESKQVQNDRDFGWEAEQETLAKQSGDAHIAALDEETRALSASKEVKQITKKKADKIIIPHYEKFTSPTGELAQIMESIRFDTNDDIVRGKANISRIMQIAKTLKRRPDILVYLEGHCDKRGTASYNLSLGSRRASSIQSMLIEQGVDKERISTISFGKEKPLREGDDDSAWSVNRRGQFKVYFR